MILTKTESLTMGKPSAPKFARNKNILVIGGSGSGKTRFFVKPNLMQMHSSYVVTDPKGTVLVECGKMLERGRPKRVDGKIVYQKTPDGKYKRTIRENISLSMNRTRSKYSIPLILRSRCIITRSHISARRTVRRTF